MRNSNFEECREHLDTFFHLSNSAKRSIFQLETNKTVGNFKNPDDTIKYLKTLKNTDNLCVSIQNIKADAVIPESSHLKNEQVESINCLLIDIDRKKEYKYVEGTEQMRCANQSEIDQLEHEKAQILAYLETFFIRPAYQVFSGNGFQIGFFFDPQPIEFSKCIKELLNNLSKKFVGCEVDTTLSTPCMVCRLAGFRNAKSKLLEIPLEGRVYRHSKLIENCQHYCDIEAIINLSNTLKQEFANPLPKPVINTYNERPICPMYTTEFNSSQFLEELIRINGLEIVSEITNNGHQYILKHCPFDSSHIKTARLGVSSNGVLFFGCFHNSCQSKTWDDIKNTLIYPNTQSLCKYCGEKVEWIEKKEGWRPFQPSTNDLHRCVNYTPNNCINQVENVDFFKEIPPLSEEELEEINKSSSIEIEDNLPRSVSVITAETGTGKSYIACKKAVERALKGLKTTIATPTKVEAEKLCKLIVKMFSDENITESEMKSYLYKAVSSKIIENSDEEYTELEIRDSLVIVTVHSYLFRKGHTHTPYKAVDELFKDRFVIIDEVHLFADAFYLTFQDTHLYKKAGENENGTTVYTQCSYCPRSAKKAGGCEGCTRSTNMFSKTSSGDTYSFNPESHVSTKNGELPSDCLEWESVFGTLFMFPVFTPELNCNKLKGIIGLEKEKPTDWRSKKVYDFIEYSLKPFAYKAFLKAEFPVDSKGEKGNPFVGIVAEDSTFPKKPCGCPIWCSLDLFPLVNLLSVVKSVVFMSATIPNQLTSLIKEVSENMNFTYTHKKYNSVSFQYNIDLLLTTEKFSVKTIDSVLTEIDKLEKETVVFLAKKHEVLTLSSISSNKEYHQNSSFWGVENGVFSMPKCQKSARNIITHARGSLATGIDLFRGFEIMIVNSCHFLPQSALFGITKNMSKADKKALLIEEVRDNLTQIFGRLLRSKLEKIEGKTIKDPRKITILAYGMDNDLLDIELCNKLCYAQRIYINKFIYKGSGLPQKIAQIVKAITSSQHYQNVEDVHTEKAIELKDKPTNSLSPKQRKIKAEISDKSPTNVIARVKEFMSQGDNKSTIKRKINFNRLNQDTQAIITQMFINNL